MSNSERLPPYEHFIDEFGRGFITDTYTSVRNSDGWDDVISISANQLNGKGEPWTKNATAGSVTAQYCELMWSIHRNDFWEWRFEQE